MLLRRGRSVVLAVLILVLATAVAMLAVQPPSPLAAAESLLRAIAFRLAGPERSANPRVVIAGITEDTLARLPYRSPIDRGFLASLIDTLSNAGVAAIGLDVLLDRPTEPDKDAALRDAMLQAAVPVVAISVAPDTPEPPERRRYLRSFLSGIRTGDANLARERFDNVVRQHRPFDPATGTPSLPVSIAQALSMPVPTHPFPIDWRRGRDGAPPIPMYPAETIPLLPRDWLRGKAVLIGSMVPGSDEHRTLASAFGRPSFGVEIHAQVLEQLLTGRAAPGNLRWGGFAAVAGMAAAGMVLAWLWAGLGAVAAGVGVSIAYAAGDIALYSGGGVLFPFVAPVLALGVAGAAVRAWRGRGERRDRRALRALFSRFVSAPVVNEIMRERDLFMAGGRPRPQELTATVLFADVARFTTICERLEPAPLIAWLDRYIDTMAAIIMAHDGVLLRFIGDGILAVFGVPVPRRDDRAVAADARNAAACALEMEQAMQRLNAQWRDEGLPEAGLRIGLHTGPLVAGSLGTGARMEFCLLGDTANVGARLEQLGKEFAGERELYCTIVAGGATWALLEGEFPGLHAGKMQLRGKRLAIDVYRIDSEAAAQVRGRDVIRSPPPLSVPAHPDRGS
jgi:class 3 adenylate cyclase/CHASE2 domain-containing sensor protein